MTTIEIQDSLYEQVTIAAQELELSQNEFLTLAIQEYLDHRRNQKLLDNLNDACADGLDESEEAMLEGMRLHQRDLSELEA